MKQLSGVEKRSSEEPTFTLIFETGRRFVDSPVDDRPDVAVRVILVLL